MNPETKQCQSCGADFTISHEDFLLYEKVGIVPPVACFVCRLAHHFAFWPFGKFRKTVSDLSGKNLITMLPVNARYPIYSATEWWSDAWDPTDYGQDYDALRPFFDQLKELQEKVPRPHQQGTHNLECDWCDDSWDSKNCYLSRSIKKAENLMYGYRAIEVKDSIDISHAYTIDNSYDCTYSFNSYDLAFSRNCRDCLNSRFLFDCRNCKDCFMCWNLRGKQYCIENKQYTKEEYLQKMKEYDLGSFKSLEKLRARYEELLRTQAVHRDNFNINFRNSTGTYMTDCNNCHETFCMETSENCRNCLRGLKNKDSIDFLGCWYMEMTGNNSCCFDCYGTNYSSWSGGRYSEYLDGCVELEYCFGCVGLKKKKYCILNKHYTKEEYESQKEKIIADMKRSGEYGQFLPYNMGLCPYNFTTAAIYLPEITKEYVEKEGGYWDDSHEDAVEGMPTSELPDHITEAGETLPKQALICPETGWRFNIAPAEFAFLQRKGFAIPRTHFDVRTKKRMLTLAPFRAENYGCMYCKKDILGYYPKEWGYQNIACEDCYKREIN